MVRGGAVGSGPHDGEVDLVVRVLAEQRGEPLPDLRLGRPQEAQPDGLLECFVGTPAGELEQAELVRVLDGSKERDRRRRRDQPAGVEEPLEPEEMGRPHPIPHPQLRGGRNHASDELVRVLPVAPPHDLEPATHRRVERPRALELGNHQHRVVGGPHDQQRQPLERRRIVARQVHEIRRGRQEESGQPGLVRRRPRAPEALLVPHSFIRIRWGITWKVAGVVPSTSPSASMGSGRSASIFTAALARSSSMWSLGMWSPL